MIKIFIFCVILLCSCQNKKKPNLEIDYYNAIQTQLILAQEGDIITLPNGKIQLNRSLWVDNLKNVIIKGMGIDKTIISFKNQSEGSEGLKIINSNNITLQDFTIEDSRGDLIKAENTRGINFISIKAQWTGRPKKTNGAYGLYPVNCEKVYIDNCIVNGASDAGIYVGQSKIITVKKSETYNNVAGIEIENSTFADVYMNYSHHNAGGILVFDLPDLIVKSGKNIRVFDNIVVENNFRNFAAYGNVVASVPSGTGIMVLATSNVEIYNNKIYNNKTANTSVVSYYILEEPITDQDYYPYVKSIYIHDNIYKRDKMLPSLSFKQPIGFLLAFNYFNNVPDIIIDGIIDISLLDDNGKPQDENKICISNNINARVLNLDAENEFNNMSENFDEYQCIHPQLDFETYNPLIR